MVSNTGTVMTIANSIIGVSVLAMPFCFKECGIFLSILMLILSSVLSRMTCFLVLKAAVMSRRRNFEFLAFHIFGTTGKFLVELCIIGFLMGTCIAFFVVVGDLGPVIVAKTLNIDNTGSLRPSVLIGLAILVVLPLGLLRNVDSLTSICTASIGFYICLVLKVIIEALPHLKSGIWVDKVEYWRPAGVLQCLPIFSMALFCQTQLFEIYETMPNASLERMNSAVRSAINICTGVYISVGFFGYVAFCTEAFSGNVLMSFSPSMLSDVIKLGFVLSVAVSFPLVIFPCRASLYSLLFRRVQVPHHEVVSSFIPEARFKCITFFIISVSLVIGLMIPNIELILGLVGSTIGVGICVIFPTMAFIFVSTKDTTDRVIAQILFFVGILILVLGTYATLFATTETSKPPLKVAVGHEFENSLKFPEIDKIIVPEKANISPIPIPLQQSNGLKEIPVKPPAPVPVVVVSEKSKNLNEINVKDVVEVRQEPPVPIEPVDSLPVEVKEVKNIENKPLPAPKANEPKVEDISVEKQVEESIPAQNIDHPEKVNNEQVINKDALKKEDEELEEAAKDAKADTEEKNNQLLLKLEKHKEEQQKLLEEQKQILQELKEQKKEADKEKEDNVPLHAVKETVPKVNEPLPVQNVKNPNNQVHLLNNEENIRHDLPKVPAPNFGYKDSPEKQETINKPSPPPPAPKQPIAYQSRFASNGDTLKRIEKSAVQSVGKASLVDSLTNKKQQLNNNPQVPSIRSLLIPPAKVGPSDTNRNKNHVVLPKKPIVVDKPVKLEKEIINNVLPPLSHEQKQEIDKIKSVEILKANDVNEAKAMRRDILGAKDGDVKSTNQDHDREKRDTLFEESYNPNIVGDVSILDEVREENKVKSENVENCPRKVGADNGEDTDSSPYEKEAVIEKINPPIEKINPPIETRPKNEDSEALIKVSSHLSDPDTEAIGGENMLNNLQKDIVENEIKPMARDLKSVNVDSNNDESKVIKDKLSKD